MREMKDSGVPWIGAIPKGWSLRRIGQMYKERRTKVSDKDYEPLSVTMKGVVPQLSTAAKTDAHDDRKLVRKGDFAINSRSDRRGSCGIAPQDGSVSLINTILCPLSETNSAYLNWLFHSNLFADEFYRWGHGIVDDLWTTNWSDMKRIYIPYPSLPEQQRIADFLDAKCAEIDSILDDTRTSIDEYKNLKLSVITEAVTKGIRGNRQMRESGVEWIGEIPVEWEMKKVKFISRAISKGNGITKDEVFEDGDIPCVRYGEIYSKYNRSFEKCLSSTRLSIHASPQYFDNGDLLLAGTGELIEDIGKSVVYTGNEKCLAGGDIIVVKQDQNPLFINYALNSAYAQGQKSRNKIKLKVVHISASEIGNILLALSPITEQQEIADYLDEKCATIDSLIASKEALITELEAYKKSIIYEYVTGKKEVPAV